MQGAVQACCVFNTLGAAATLLAYECWVFWLVVLAPDDIAARHIERMERG